MDGEDVYFSSGDPISLPLAEGVDDANLEPETDHLEPENITLEPSQHDHLEPTENQIPEPITQIPEPFANDSKQAGSQIPEPEESNTRTQIPEPIETKLLEPEDGQMPEPGFEINTDDLLSTDRQLWRLETYADRHKVRRVRRVLRFISGKPPQEELGKVTDEISDSLRQRCGHGRWAKSRIEAEDCRLLAYAVAEHHYGLKAARREGKVLQNGGRNAGRADGRVGMSEASDSIQWPDVPNLLNYRQEKIAKAS